MRIVFWLLLVHRDCRSLCSPTDQAWKCLKPRRTPCQTWTGRRLSTRMIASCPMPRSRKFCNRWAFFLIAEVAGVKLLDYWYCNAVLFILKSRKTKLEVPLLKLMDDYSNFQNIFLSFKSWHAFFILLIHIVSFNSESLLKGLSAQYRTFPNVVLMKLSKFGNAHLCYWKQVFWYWNRVTAPYRQGYVCPAQGGPQHMSVPSRGKCWTTMKQWSA